MNKIYNLKGEIVTHTQAKELFHQGESICMISYRLKIFQSECVELLSY